MYKFLISAFLVHLAVHLASAVKFPGEFLRCPVPKHLDGKSNDCLKKAIEKGIHFLSIDGSRELGAIDLDPMQINKINIERGENRPVAIKLIYTNNTMTGLSNILIQNVKGRMSSPNGFEMVMEGLSEEMSLVGPYKISGKVLVLPIQGVGISNMTMKNMKSVITIRGSPMMKNGKEYLKIDYFHLDMQPSRLYMWMGNLFNGDKALGDNMNRFLNENWEDIYNELRDAIEDAFSAIFKEYTKRIFAKVPFNNVFIQS